MVGRLCTSPIMDQLILYTIQADLIVAIYAVGLGKLSTDAGEPAPVHDEFISHTRSVLFFCMYAHPISIHRCTKRICGRDAGDGASGYMKDNSTYVLCQFRHDGGAFNY